MSDNNFRVSNTPGIDCYQKPRVDAQQVTNAKENLLWLPGSDTSKFVHYTPKLSIFQWISNLVSGWMSKPPMWVPVNIQWVQGDVRREYDAAIADPLRHPESRVVVYINVSDLEQVEIPLKNGSSTTIQEREGDDGIANEKNPEDVARHINRLIVPLIYPRK